MGRKKTLKYDLHEMVILVDRFFQKAKNMGDDNPFPRAQKMLDRALHAIGLEMNWDELEVAIREQERILRRDPEKAMITMAVLPDGTRFYVYRYFWIVGKDDSWSIFGPDCSPVSLRPLPLPS